MLRKVESEVVGKLVLIWSFKYEGEMENLLSELCMTAPLMRGSSGQADRYMLVISEANKRVR